MFSPNTFFYERARLVPHERSVDLFPTNGKRMVYLDNMSPRGQEQAFHALYGACGRFGEPLGASWGIRRASNGFEHGLPARTVKRLGTVSVQVLDVAPRGFPLAESEEPPYRSGRMWKAQRRRRKPREGALGAPGGHSGAPRTDRLPFVSV